ncbi:hypothetical protein FHT76_001785 [Rhizobium sp. BK176]|nr:hypothetical protein [Rhizobium sp. BK176]
MGWKKVGRYWHCEPCAAAVGKPEKSS